MLSWFKRKRRRKRPKRKRRLFRDIYLLWSPRYGHKIGISDEARRRRAWIKEDGLPGVLILVGWFSVVDAPGIEEDLHRRFDRFRYTIRPQVSGRTEFFRLGGIRSRLPVLSWLLGFLRACWVWWLMFEVWIAQRLFVVLVISAISYLAVKVIC